MSDIRYGVRTTFRTRIKLVCPEIGEIIAHTRDISDHGIYVAETSEVLSIGTIVDAQIQDTPMEAPVIKMVVVRRDAEGYGLAFIRD